MSNMETHFDIQLALSPCLVSSQTLMRQIMICLRQNEIFIIVGAFEKDVNDVARKSFELIVCRKLEAFQEF